MSYELKEAIGNISHGLDVFKAQESKRIDELNGRVEHLEALGDRPSGRVGNLKSAEYKAFSDHIRTGSGLQQLSQTKDMSIVAGAADGAALVPELIADQIVARALGAGGLTSIVRRTTSPTSDYVRLLNMRGQTASWIAETSSRTTTANLRLREIRPTHGEIYSAVTVSNWLLNDSKFDVAAMILENSQQQFARSLETAVYSGSGTNRPTGLVATTPVTTADSGSPERAAGALQYVVGTSDLANDLVGIYFKLKPEYRKNATWVMSSASLAAVRKLRDTGGSGFLFQENGRADADFSGGTILGKPVVNCEDMPTGGGSPQTFAFFVGDFVQGYELVQLGGMSVLRDPYSARGFTTIYVAARFGGKLVDNDAIKVLKA